jgi:predicted actin-binding protein
MLAPLLTVLALATAGPANLAAPSAHGTARVGSQLTASPGSWKSSGTITYGYQWTRCDASGSACVTIAGATSGVYTPGAADVGKTLAVSVAATDPSGKVTLDSPLIGPIATGGALATTAQPVVSGTAKLAVTKGTWTTAPAAVTYAWLRCDRNGRACSAIAGATAATYTVTAADGGHRLVARLQATAGSAKQTALSLPSVLLGSGATTTTTTTTTAAPPSAPTYPRPVVTGAAEVGQRLVATAPAGLPSGATVAFQWYRCDGTGARCLSVHGATARTYREVAADVGRTLAVTAKVTAGGTTTPVYSSLLGPIVTPTALAISTAQPKVTGQAQQGQTLTAGGGTWSKTPATVNFAWQRCNQNGRICLTIEDATKPTYVPTAADVGHALASLVVVTIGNGTATAFSTATDPVKPAGLVNTAPPMVAGTLRIGQKLSAAPGIWTGAQPIAYHYQWYRCDANGAHCLSIHGATAATYTLVARDAGQTIGLTVTASNATDKKPAYASLAGPIAAAAATLVSTARPGLSGTAAVGQVLTATAGTWSATPAASTFQWLRCNQNGRVCVPIDGATSASYTVTPTDSGHALVALVTATAGGQSTKTLSLAGAPVAS